MLYFNRKECNLENKILMERICRMIAMNYAMPEEEVINAYNMTNSIDFVIKAIRNSIANHTSLQHEISKKEK